MNPVAMLRERKIAIPDRYGVDRIGVFGSFVRHEEKQTSDVDILVEFSRDRKTFDHYMSLKYFLQDLCGRGVDLVTGQALKPRLKEHILRGVVYA